MRVVDSSGAHHVEALPMRSTRLSLKKWRTMAFATVLVAGGSQAALAIPVDYNFSGTLSSSAGNVTGTFTYDSTLDNITSYSFLLPSSPTLNPVSGSSYTLDNSDSGMLNFGSDKFRFYVNGTDFTNLDLFFTSVGGVLQFDLTAPGFGSSGLRQGPNVTGSQPTFDEIFVSGAASTVGSTPLPAALPLFASGLVALGLFGWARRRKMALAA